MDNKALVRELYERVTNQRTFERLPALMTTEFASQYQAAVQVLMAGFPDVQFTLVDLVAEGDQVVVRWQWRGTHTGVFRGIAPTQAVVLNDGVVIYEVSQGKLARSWTLNDRLGLLQTLGVVSRTVGQPPAPAK